MAARVSYFNTNANYLLVAPTISTFGASNPNPNFNETFYITTSVSNENAVYLGYRTNHELKFTRIPMFDDGNHGDGAAGDHVYGVSVTAGGPVFEYYIYADNSNAGLFSPQRAEHEFHVLDLNIPAPNAGEVQINEVMSDNNSTHDDPYGESNDWIELHNNSVNAVDISGLFLSDDVANPQKWVLPSNTVLLPNDYLIVWTDNDTLQTTGLHANFKMSASGDYLSLFNASTLLDQVTVPSLLTDQSYARCPETGVVFDYASPTFDAMNNCSAGLQESALTISVFPNPTQAELTMILPQAGLLKIADINGRMVYEGYMGQGIQTLMVEKWNCGIYLASIQFTNGTSQTFKIIKL
mgnify:FL=1